MWRIPSRVLTRFTDHPMPYLTIVDNKRDSTGHLKMLLRRPSRILESNPRNMIEEVFWQANSDIRGQCKRAKVCQEQCRIILRTYLKNKKSKMLKILVKMLPLSTLNWSQYSLQRHRIRNNRRQTSTILVLWNSLSHQGSSQERSRMAPWARSSFTKILRFLFRSQTSEMPLSFTGRRPRIRSKP